MVVFLEQWFHNMVMIKSAAFEIREAKMLEEIRHLLKLTIEDFVYQMDWPNTKYYDYIKNGRRRPDNPVKKLSHPTIYKVFTGINLAISQYPHWQNHATEITSIVLKYLLPTINKK